METYITNLQQQKITWNLQFIIRTLSFINAIFVFFLRVALQIVNKVFYVILIAFAGSPFSCMVDQIDGSYVTAFGAGLVGGMSGQMVSFTVTAKQGSLSKSPVILIPPTPTPPPPQPKRKPHSKLYNQNG